MLGQHPDVHMTAQRRTTAPSSITLTVRLKPKVKGKLDRLAKGTNRTRSFLAAQAITEWVERELEIVEGIQRGLADSRAGRVVPHHQVVARLEATLARAEQ